MEAVGVDIFGNEIFPGDDIVILPNGEIVLKESLEDFLMEELGFRFEKAK